MRTVGLTACALVAAAIVARILWLFTNRVPVLAHAENVDALGDTMPGDPLNPPEHPQGLQRMSPFHTADMRLEYEVAGKHYERDVETHSIDGLDITAPDDMPILWADPSKFRAATGWEPKIPFEQTLRDVLDYWRERVAAEDKPARAGV